VSGTRISGTLWAARRPDLKTIAASIPAVKADRFDLKLAERLVELSLVCVDKEYPNKPSDVQSSDKSVVPPRTLHPSFFGCFDWHSSVHGHWTMVRILKTFPKIKAATRIRKALDRHLNPKELAGELRYFQGKHHKLFERPYGWGWFLRLAAELATFEDPDAKRWAQATAPLERLLVERTRDYLKRLSVPVRAGTHHSTAFALAHIHDYARIKGERALTKAINVAARRFYLADVGCPTDYEPSGEDFISPCLAEADLMRRVLAPAAFRAWLGKFLPGFASPRFKPMLKPPAVLDIKDAKIGHLIGLMFHRAWAMKGVARALGKQDARAAVLFKLAALHRREGLKLMFASGYGGTHWLASFAVFLLTDAGL
jgi:hypothetical protein